VARPSHNLRIVASPARRRRVRCKTGLGVVFAGLRIATLDLDYRSGYQRLQDLQIDVGKAPDVDTYLPSLVLSQLGQQDVTTFETRSDVNNQLTSPHGKPSESRIAFVTTGVLVMIAPESDDAWPPHPWFSLGNSSHKSNQSLGVIPLLLVRDGSNVTLDTDFSRFGLGLRHVHLQTGSFRRITLRLSGERNPSNFASPFNNRHSQPSPLQALVLFRLE